jgi:GntR family transcriptional repressor for pyruvate dehydrogenase complex
MTMRVVHHIRALIESGALQPGGRIPPEREFARKLRISRASLRTGIGYLVAMGILDVRHGVGTFVADGPPELGKSALSLLGSLHHFQPWQMFEARRIVESQLAALAAERGSEQHFVALAAEVVQMAATIDNPVAFLFHDLRFHRIVAQASGNPILAAVMETIVSALYDERRKTVDQARDLRQSIELHRDLTRAISARNAAQASALMERHLSMAQSAQAQEPIPATPAKRTPPRKPTKLAK